MCGCLCCLIGDLTFISTVHVLVLKGAYHDELPNTLVFWLESSMFFHPAADGLVVPQQSCRDRTQNVVLFGMRLAFNGCFNMLLVFFDGVYDRDACKIVFDIAIFGRFHVGLLF